MLKTVRSEVWAQGSELCSLIQRYFSIRLSDGDFFEVSNSTRFYIYIYIYIELSYLT